MNVKKIKSAAVVLAAGSGKRMKTGRAKQFLTVSDRPVLFYALDAFEKSMVDDIILVTGKDDIDFCREEIVEKYGISKVRSIISGGKERYHSVARGLFELDGDDKKTSDDAAAEIEKNGLKRQSRLKPDIVMIHDGARPFVTAGLINKLLAGTAEYGACVTGTPVKDTIKVVDSENITVDTPDRKTLWAVQTPQAFSFDMILKAYKELLEKEEKLLEKGIFVTDDSMVLELMSGVRTKLIEGSYLNIKLTTPDDLLMAERILQIVSSNV